MIDAPLSPAGRQAALRLRESLAPHRFELIVTSPLTRALETTRIVFGGTGAVLRVSAAMREHGAHPCDLGRPPALLAAEYPEFDFSALRPRWWGDAAAADAFVAEPLEALHRRCAAFRRWLGALHVGSLAVVGHGTFLEHLLGVELRNCELHWAQTRELLR